ncbi:hypothetical protein ACWCL1_06125 [Ligilactobacillus sp. LYQ135]
MEHIRKSLRKFLTIVTVLVMTIAIPFFGQINVIKANNITQSMVTSITPSSLDVRPGQKIRYTLKFGNPNFIIHAYDTIYLEFPNPTETTMGIQGIPVSSASVIAKDSEGSTLTVGSAEITKSDVTITFNENIDGKAIESGTFIFYGIAVAATGSGGISSSSTSDGILTNSSSSLSASEPVGNQGSSSNTDKDESIVISSSSKPNSNESSILDSSSSLSASEPVGNHGSSSNTDKDESIVISSSSKPNSNESSILDSSSDLELNSNMSLNKSMAISEINNANGQKSLNKTKESLIISNNSSFIPSIVLSNSSNSEKQTSRTSNAKQKSNKHSQNLKNSSSFKIKDEPLPKTGSDSPVKMMLLTLAGLTMAVFSGTMLYKDKKK